MALLKNASDIGFINGNDLVLECKSAGYSLNESGLFRFMHLKLVRLVIMK